VTAAVTAASAPSKKKLVTRRGLLKAGALLLGASALEYESLSGKFDHDRRIILGGEARFRASMDALANDASLARGAIVHVGHSTHLLVVDGVRLLTDPWFYDPAFGAVRHEHALPVGPHSLEPLDAILITHDHADHVDHRALWFLEKSAVCLVATDALATRCKNSGFEEVHVLRPWESFVVKGVKVTAVPGLHDIYEIGFVVEGGAGRDGGAEGAASRAARNSVYFAGDSRLFPQLDEIAERFVPAASILPVDGTRLRGGDLHVMRPEDAVVAARTLKSRVVMPSHAEGILFDPLAKYVITENIEHAGAIFADLMKSALPSVTCAVPEPGDIVAI
jgi:L-ascorbate metabolism protein UlaG (beta-lactamase superfamily)